MSFLSDRQDIDPSQRQQHMGKYAKGCQPIFHNTTVQYNKTCYKYGNMLVCCIHYGRH